MIINLKQQEEKIVTKLNERRRNNFIKDLSKSNNFYKKRYCMLAGTSNTQGTSREMNVSTFDGLPTPPENQVPDTICESKTFEF